MSKASPRVLASSKKTGSRATVVAKNQRAARALVAVAKKSSSADRDRAEALLSEIARRRTRIAEDFYEIGEALRELLKKKLYVALGYPSFADMLKARNVMSPTQAGKLIQLVSSVPREKALAIGSEKAFLLVDYARATPEPDNAAWLLEQGKLPGGKRVADASTREIVAATKAVRAKAGTAKRKSAEQDAADGAAHRVQASLRKRGAKSAIASAVKKGSAWWVRVELKVAHAPALD